MTRINCGIPPSELRREHLLAEHREIIRIPNALREFRLLPDNIPDKFKLGTGHVKFFADKVTYLQERYEAIYNECKRRNYNVSYYGTSFKRLPDKLKNNYRPTRRDVKIIRNRILERSGCKNWNEYKFKN